MLTNLLLRIQSIFFQLSFVFISFFAIQNTSAQLFPNPADLSTGQGAPGTIDPLWLASPWYSSSPPNPMGLTYISTTINNNCAPGAWVDPASLPAPVNNGNWITGSDGVCNTNTNDGYRYFRLTLNLPSDCNGFSVTVPGNYVLNLVGYADNAIADVFVNGTSTGISGGGFSAGTQLSITLNGPWVVGTNYVDVLVFNAPSGTPGATNPYGLLLVADANATNAMDTDGDGISNLNDLCPCDPGTNPYGCEDPTLHNCDMNLIRQTFTNAGCVEMPGCSSDCSIYFLNPVSLTGADAQSFAQSLGANLVSIQSQAENDCVLSSLNNLGYTSNEVVWIGFNDETTEGTFVWYDQAPITYTNWAPGEPNNSGGNEDCVQIYPAGANPGTWNDLSCTSSNSMSIIEVNLCPVTSIGTDQIICLGESTDIDVEQTLFGSAPYTYLWNNNQSTASITVSPTVTDTFSVLTTDAYQCEAVDSMIITVLLPPSAEFSADTVCQGIPTQFTDLSTTPSGTTINAWEWDFGDGNSSNLSNPTHTYTTNGVFSVQLIVTSNNGCKDTFNLDVLVFEKPVAGIITADNCQFEQINFNDNSTISQGSIVGWNWNFGDGTVNSNIQNPTHVYSTNNTYTVELIVSSNEGCLDTITENVTIFEKPTANFSALDNCEGTTISFTNTSISSGTITTNEWDFNDGNLSNLGNPTHIFTQDGNYSVILIVTDNNGCKDTINHSITIFPTMFSSITGSICDGEAFIFGGNSYSTPGTYVDNLQTIHGCDSTVTLTLSEFPTPPSPELSSNSPLECPGDELILSMETVPNATYFWTGPNGFTSQNQTVTLPIDETNTGVYSGYVTVNGCPSPVQSELVTLNGSFTIDVNEFPNVISANNDGINDYLDLDQYFNSCLPYEFTLINRWGGLVYTQKLGEIPFQGKDLNGGILEEGVYFYTLEYGGSKLQGFITLIR